MWGSIIGAVGNIAGGLIGSQGAANANDKAADSAANALAKQEEFARNAVRWRAQDVMNAYKETGIHPLALLGAQTSSFSPVAVNFGNEGAPIGESLARAGSDISRSIAAGADRELRQEALDLQRAQLNNMTERSGLENMLLKMRIASEWSRMTGTGPGMPSPNDVNVLPGQGDTKVATWKAPNWMFKNKGLGSNQAFETPIPGIGMQRLPDGSILLTKSDKGSNMLEDDFLGNLQHWVARTFGVMGHMLPPGTPGKRWYRTGLGTWAEEDSPRGHILGFKLPR